MRGTGKGDGKGYLWAHRWCAPTLDDLRGVVESLAEAAREGKQVAVRWSAPLSENPEAAARLFREAPLVFEFAREWEPWLGPGYKYRDLGPGEDEFQDRGPGDGGYRFEDEEDFGEAPATAPWARAVTVK